MFKLTNDQRKCFALVPVRDQWERIEAKPSPYDQFKTYLYLEGDTIVKCILSGDSQYCEYELSEMSAWIGNICYLKRQRGSLRFCHLLPF